jgi:hypothetical protein
MALLYADENFDAAVVAQLRALGHDVQTVQEANRRGCDDPTVLADATAAGRAVLTFNRRHFIGLHRQSSAHHGIIACSDDPDASALAIRIHDALGSVASLRGALLRINRPSSS